MVRYVTGATFRPNFSKTPQTMTPTLRLLSPACHFAGYHGSLRVLSLARVV